MLVYHDLLLVHRSISVYVGIIVNIIPPLTEQLSSSLLVSQPQMVAVTLRALPLLPYVIDATQAGTRACWWLVNAD